MLQSRPDLSLDVIGNAFDEAEEGKSKAGDGYILSFSGALALETRLLAQCR